MKTYKTINLMDFEEVYAYDAAWRYCNGCAKEDFRRLVVNTSDENSDAKEISKYLVGLGFKNCDEILIHFKW